MITWYCVALQDCELNELRTMVQQLQRQSQDQFVANGFSSAGMFVYLILVSNSVMSYFVTKKTHELWAIRISLTQGQNNGTQIIIGPMII